MKLFAALFALTATLLLPFPLHAADWYQWRGPEQDGVSREKNLPEHWSPDGDNVLWHNDVGGMSSPIVMNGKLYAFTRTGQVPAGDGATATLDPGPQTQEEFVCLDAKTGALLWKHDENMFVTDVPFHRLGWSNPVGDPATARVYALGAQCVFNCFDANTGKVLWSRQMTEEFGMISTFGGRTPSPAIDEDQVFIAGVSFGWGDHAGGQHRIFAFDKNTGELRWSAGTGGIPVDAPYNTPVIAVIGGQRLVLFAGGDGGIHAFQARTGKKVWSFKGSKHGMNSSVVVHADRVFASWDLDNYDSTRLGRVVCLDGANVVNGSPREVWRQDGIEAGFPSPTLYDGTLYVPTDTGQIYALDEKTGAIKYHHGFGTIGKASLVFADGKIYYPEANGRMWILKPTDTKFEVLSHEDLDDKPGREYVIFGSVAVSDGHVFLQAASKMYCIGPKDPKVESDPIPEPPQEPPLAKLSIVAPDWLQFVPADALLHPGQKQTFTVHFYDHGQLMDRFIFGINFEGLPPSKPTDGDHPQWSIAQLVMPPPPPRPKELMRLNSMTAAQPMTAPPPPPPASSPATPPPATQPTRIGNLLGDVDASGTFTAATGSFQGGAVAATLKDWEKFAPPGYARVRVLPPLPWSITFDKTPAGKPPLTWIGAGAKFAARDLDGKRVLVKLTDIPLYARARTYFGSADMKDYTLQADVRVTETVFDISGAGVPVHQMPDAGVINQRYVLELKGSKQTLGLHAWPAALPRDEIETNLALHKTIPFAWKADAWYREKLRVEHKDGKAILSGKAWEVGQPEPADWMIVLEDTQPNLNGAPGLWGFSNNHEIYYDNILVNENNP